MGSEVTWVPMLLRFRAHLDSEVTWVPMLLRFRGHLDSEVAWVPRSLGFGDQLDFEVTWIPRSLTWVPKLPRSLEFRNFRDHLGSETSEITWVPKLPRSLAFRGHLGSEHCWPTSIGRAVTVVDRVYLPEVTQLWPPYVTLQYI
eukprot:1322931-Amorphochlora_amoeboformis.AAC.1